MNTEPELCNTCNGTGEVYGPCVICHGTGEDSGALDESYAEWRYERGLERGFNE